MHFVALLNALNALASLLLLTGLGEGRSNDLFGIFWEGTALAFNLFLYDTGYTEKIRRNLRCSYNSKGILSEKDNKGNGDKF